MISSYFTSLFIFCISLINSVVFVTFLNSSKIDGGTEKKIDLGVPDGQDSEIFKSLNF